MDTSIVIFLAVAGVISTIIFGYIGVRYTLKYRKKTNIIFLKNTCISLFKTIVRNLDDIEINFQGKKIDENLILLKGTFFNNGNVDIDKSIIHKPLEIELPSNFSWVTYKIINTSNDLEVKLIANDNKLSFDWDLFKEGEYITFDCLIEYKHIPEETDDSDYDISRVLLNKIKFNHRITNLKTVSKEGSIRRPISAGFLITFSLFLLAFVSGGYYISIGQYFFPSYKLLHEVTIDSEKHYVELRARDNSNISLLDNNEEELKAVPIDKLNEYLSKNTLIEGEGISYWKLVGVGFLSTIYLFLFFVMLFSEAKDRRLYKKLKSVADNQDNLEREGRITPLSFLLK